MSTIPYGPNDEYLIGTVGIESLKPKGFLDFFQNIPSYLSMIGNIIVPTYGLWAVPADSVMFGLLPKRYPFERPLKAFCLIIEGLWPSR